MPFVRNRETGNRTMWIAKDKLMPDQPAPQVIYETDKMTEIFPCNASGIWTIWANPSKSKTEE